MPLSSSSSPRFSDHCWSNEDTEKHEEEQHAEEGDSKLIMVMQMMVMLIVMILMMMVLMMMMEMEMMAMITMTMMTMMMVPVFVCLLAFYFFAFICLFKSRLVYFYNVSLYAGSIFFKSVLQLFICFVICCYLAFVVCLLHLFSAFVSMLSIGMRVVIILKMRRSPGQHSMELHLFFSSLSLSFALY